VGKNSSREMARKVPGSGEQHDRTGKDLGCIEKRRKTTVKRVDNQLIEVGKTGDRRSEMNIRGLNTRTQRGGCLLTPSEGRIPQKETKSAIDRSGD